MKTKLSLLLVSVIFLAACAAPTPTAAPAIDPAGSTMPALTDPSLPISVKVGETFMIVVESNPSTGYHWEMIGDSANIEFISREYTASEPVMPGSGGVEVWTLKASASGDTKLVLGNYPPGNDTSYEQEKSFTIAIQ